MTKIERFPNHLDCRKRQGYDWELLNEFKYVSRRWGTLTVPAGFHTDFASIPWFARWYVSRDGDHTKAAVVHDFGYSRASLGIAPWDKMSRRDIDLLFLEALAIRGVRSGQRLVMYYAVRLGGWLSFKKV